MKPVLVIGLGNPWMSDEGIGPRVVTELAGQKDVPENVEFVDLGTGGAKLLHLLRGRRKLVAIDCAVMGEAPGTIRRFGPAEAKSVQLVSRLSLHEHDLLRTLELAYFLGEGPEEVIIFGIEPQSLAPGETLSPALEGRVRAYVETIGAELKGSATGAGDGASET